MGYGHDTDGPTLYVSGDLVWSIGPATRIESTTKVVYSTTDSSNAPTTPVIASLNQTTCGRPFESEASFVTSISAGAPGATPHEVADSSGLGGWLADSRRSGTYGEHPDANR